MNGQQPETPFLTLREMTVADIDAITAMDATLFGVDSWPRHMFVDELARPETRRYIIAEVSGQAGHLVMAGYAGLMCIPPIGDIQTIGVLPQYEGHGYARAMLVELIDEARRRGAQEVMLEVSSTNPRAQELYRRFGFEHIHTRRKYYRDGSDGLIMRLQLSEPHAVNTQTQETDPA
ncbi:ribosomal protein S18-alanine N-acetyltransferase [Arthrobacter alpinus]|uniref:ribosomal protein S18-alanine N-acetyltransferase n=1 Tax=Arthrobacter alpinus TaxID=656366 RepID=UPI0028F6C562|nr:ribosomal protein S18-alanine N-acetyltransferase [Arthrobacter alpinus]